VVYFKRSLKEPLKLKSEYIEEVIRNNFTNQIFNLDQEFVVDVSGKNLILIVDHLSSVTLESIKSGENESGTKKRGILIKQSSITFEQEKDSPITITGANKAVNELFKHDFNFEQLGIGGLDKEFASIFRRSFASRVFPSEIIQNLGVKHVKGMLLYGPPGTGKTLIARQIGKMLNAREPKIVNGPEVLNKYVGQSEENIRALFKEAEEEYEEKKEDSQLHIIIFDELDAVCKSRGSGSTGGTGVGDSVVNQLLSKMDGVNQINNILVIGMTNRPDLIDEALLRSGRLEVHMEIGLPDETGRLQILNIHTATMKKNGYLDTDVSLSEIAGLTKNFTGAEIEGLVRSATSFALNRQIDAKNPTKPVKPEEVTVNKSDFANALGEVKPTFGVSEGILEDCMRNGIIHFSDEFESVYENGKLFIEQIKNSNRTPVVSILLSGAIGSGKTALSAQIAKYGEFPLVRFLSAEDFVGLNENSKVQKISKCFHDAYKSPYSCIIMDDIERFLDYVPLGHRFSNSVLQTLLVLFKQTPTKNHKLLIIGTTSNENILSEMGFLDVVGSKLDLPNVKGNDQIKIVLEKLGYKNIDGIRSNMEIPIKKLILTAELALTGSSGTYGERFDKFSKMDR
jgi:vesicle-fusing ATPase